MLVQAWFAASCHPAGGVNGPMVLLLETENTATSRLPACVGCVQFAVRLNIELALLAASWRRVICMRTTIVAVVLLTVAVPLHVLVTRTQYDVPPASGGVV